MARLRNVPRGTWHLTVWHEALDGSDGSMRGSTGESTDGSMREIPAPTQACFVVTVGDRDLVRSLTLREDGAIR